MSEDYFGRSGQYPRGGGAYRPRGGRGASGGAPRGYPARQPMGAPAGRGGYPSRGHYDPRFPPPPPGASGWQPRGGGGGGRGGRGGGGGAPFHFRPKRPSYGVVLWATVDGQDYFLMQVSYSKGKYDFKLDPFRGKVLDFSEKKHETAARLAFEESAHTIDLRQLGTMGEPIDNLFHLRACFESEPDFASFLAAYDRNRATLVKHSPAKLSMEVTDCEGLAWVRGTPSLRVHDTSDIRNQLFLAEDGPGYRAANQVVEMLSRLPAECWDASSSANPTCRAPSNMFDVVLSPAQVALGDGMLTTFIAKKRDTAAGAGGLSAFGGAGGAWQFSPRFAEQYLASDDDSEIIWAHRREHACLFHEDIEKMVKTMVEPRRLVKKRAEVAEKCGGNEAEVQRVMVEYVFSRIDPKGVYANCKKRRCRAETTCKFRDTPEGCRFCHCAETLEK